MYEPQVDDRVLSMRFNMWTLLLVVSLVGTSGGFLLKRQGDPTPVGDPVQGIVDVNEKAYNTALDDLKQLKADVKNCEKEIEDLLEDCKAYVKNKCETGPMTDGLVELDFWKVGFGIGDVDKYLSVLDLSDLDLDTGDANDNGLRSWRKKRSYDQDSLRSLLILRGIKEQLKKAAKKAAKKAEEKAKKAANKAADAAKKAAEAAKMASDALAEALLGKILFCMDKSDICHPFLENDDHPFLNDDDINEVCGTELLTNKASLAYDVDKIRWIADAVLDSDNPLAVRLTETGGTDTYVTARFPTGEERYKSDFPGTSWGTEYSKKYDEYWKTYHEYD